MNFRMLALGSVASIALVSGAVAADLPVRTAAPAPAPVFVAPAFSWAGFYAGLNAGGAWTTGCKTYDLFVEGNRFNGWSDDNCRSSDTQFTGGAQVGYNFQSGKFVYGVEADINFLGNSNGGTRERVIGDELGTVRITGVGDPGVFGTVRARLGFAADRALFYVTGGLAWASGGNDPQIAGWEGPAVGAPDAVFRRNGRNDIGWTLGAGAEYAITNNWTIRAEYLYVDLGSEDNAWSCAGPSCSLAREYKVDFSGRKDAHFNVVRVGVNYKFGGASSAPVIARY